MYHTLNPRVVVTLMVEHVKPVLLRVDRTKQNKEKRNGPGASDSSVQKPH